jgi:c-di-GMP-related signal transduction protein
MGDSANLNPRRAVLVAVVEALRARRDDRGHLLDLVEAARKDAWDDIAREVGEALDRSNIVVDGNYERERARRMREVSRDLARLAASAG